MFIRPLLIILISFLCVNFPNSDCYAKRRKKRTKKTASRKKRKSNKTSKKKGKQTAPISEDQKFKTMKDKMSVPQFKEMWQSWNKSQMLGKTYGKKPKITNKHLAKLNDELKGLQIRNNGELSDINSLKERINALKKQLEELKKQKPRRRKDKKKLKARIEELNEEIARLEKELEEKLNNNSETKGKIDQLKSQLSEAQKEAAKISEAELLMMEPIDMTGLTEEQKKVIESLRNKIQKIITGYEQTGQLDKVQYKELVKLIQELTALLRKYAGSKGNVVNFRERINTLQSLISELEDAYRTKGMLNKAKLRKTISILKEDMKVWDNIDNNNVKQIIHKGLVFKVQMATYKNRDLNKYGKPQKNDVLEQENKGNLHQYTLRTFRNYWKANEFKKQMRAIMGFERRERKGEKLQGAPFIVAYQDGKRIDLKRVENIIKSQKSN